MRGREGKDGNPLNEVRVLSGSLLERGGTLTIDKSITWRPVTTVLGLEPGDTIALDAARFARLADASAAASTRCRETEVRDPSGRIVSNDERRRPRHVPAAR